MLSVKQGGNKHHFRIFGMTRPGYEPRSPGPVVNTLLIRPMSRLDGEDKIIHLAIYNMWLCVHWRTKEDGRSSLDGLGTSCDFKLFHYSSQALGDCSKYLNYYWYHRHIIIIIIII